MEQVHRIKELQLQEKGPYQIAKELNMDPKTVRKYMDMEDFSPPKPATRVRESKLDPFKPTINQWLLEDELNRPKQRHTAKRVYNRLRKECPNFDGSYVIVNRYVQQFKKQRNQRKKGFIPLEWYPGEAQADFGECDIILNGMRQTCRYLVVSFPYSNAAYVQTFLGETAECLCQGLMDIFLHIKGVPQRIVMDNATAAGRRMGDVVRLTQLFKRFQSHFGFELTFCNPNSGHEKGNVENKVGYVRRNFFVPVPSVASLQEWNTELFEECDIENATSHYKKAEAICELFEQDQMTMRPLPSNEFEACRYEQVKTNGYGKFVLDGKHAYSSSPMFANEHLNVRISAHFVEPLDFLGTPISRHIRQFGTVRTDTVDWLTMLDSLIAKPGAWKNSAIRQHVSDHVCEYMDDQDRSGLRQSLRVLKELSGRYGFDIAVTSMTEAITRRRTEGISVNTAVIAARIAHYGLYTPGEPGPDMSVYDLLLPASGGAGNGPE
jgi:transposase